MSTIPATPTEHRTALAHSAGVLAHGMHAIAHHITSHHLALTQITVTPVPNKHRPSITVQVGTWDLDPWLNSVHIDQHDDPTQTTGTNGVYRRTTWLVRLPDSGVVVELLCVELISLVTA